MLRQITFSACLLTLLALAAAAQEQQLALPDNGVRVTDASPAVQGSARTRHLMRFAGAFKDPLGRPMTGVHGVTFALYRDREGGSPIWLETTSAEFDEQGRFTALLGAASEQGLTPELFASGEPRWLGVQLQLPGYEEQPRTLLVAVPYAIKALDADTLGGLPASAFLRSDSPTTTERPEAPTMAAGMSLPSPLFLDGSGTVGRIAKFTSSSQISDSAIFESGGNIGIGTTAPGAKLEVTGPVYLNAEGSGIVVDAAGLKRVGFMKYLGLEGALVHSGVPLRFGRTSTADITAGSMDTFTAEMVIDTAGKVGLGTTTPAAKLHVVGPGDGSATIKIVDSGNASLELRSSITSSPYIDFTINSTSEVFAGTPDFHGRIMYNQTAAHGLSFATNGVSDRMVISSTGNVGIGSVAPANKLEVAGNIKITTGGLVFPDGTVQTTAAGSLAFDAPDDVRLFISRQQQQIERLQAELLELRATFEQFRAASAR